MHEAQVVLLKVKLELKLVCLSNIFCRAIPYFIQNAKFINIRTNMAKYLRRKFTEGMLIAKTCIFLTKRLSTSGTRMIVVLKRSLI